MSVESQAVTGDHHGDSSLGSGTSAMARVFRESELDLVVARRESAAGDVVALTLTDPAGGVLPWWTPGAHIDLVLDDSLVRQYSLCGAPQDRRRWRIGVLLAPDSKGGSRRVHDGL